MMMYLCLMMTTKIPILTDFLFGFFFLALSLWNNFSLTTKVAAETSTTNIIRWQWAQFFYFLTLFSSYLSQNVIYHPWMCVCVGIFNMDHCGYSILWRKKHTETLYQIPAKQNQNHIQNTGGYVPESEWKIIQIERNAALSMLRCAY